MYLPFPGAGTTATRAETNTRDLPEISLRRFGCGRIGVKTIDFIVEMMGFTLEMMDFILKTMGFLQEMMDFILHLVNLILK